MSDNFEGPPQSEVPKKDISRRKFLKILGGAAVGALGVKGAQEVSEVDIGIRNPLRVENLYEGKEFHPDPIEIFAGEVVARTSPVQDSSTGEIDSLNIRPVPFTKTEKPDRIDEFSPVTNFDLSKIKSVNGVDLNGAKSFSIENPLIVHGENVDPKDPNGNKWVKVEVELDGSDRKLDGYFNISGKTETVASLYPAENAPEGNGFMEIKEENGILMRLEQGAFSKLAPENIGMVTIQETAQQP